MRILHVTHQYYPAIGGAERYITGLSEELARRGHQIDVFTVRSTDYLTWRNVLPAYECHAGVRIFRFHSLARRGYTWQALGLGLNNYWRDRSPWYEPLIFLGNGPLSPAMFWAILQQAHRYDLVHINMLHYAHALPAYTAARLRRVPVVITPHIHATQSETYDVNYMRRILQNSDMVFADSTAEKRFLLQRKLSHNVVVAGHGLQLQRFPPVNAEACRARFGIPTGAFVILFLGRKVEYKGILPCLNAFIALRQQRQDVYLLAVGPETDYSRRLWSHYHHVDGLVVRGAVSDAERLAALGACDVLAVPSTGEAFGIVYLEAWAYHKPVLGAQIDSVASLIDHEQNGFLVDNQQPGQLYRYLSQLSANPDMGIAMGEHGYAKLVARYTVERITDIVEGSYARVMRRHNTIAEGNLPCTLA